ncbi:MAG: tetratricopeptide repeat protein [Bacteroidota bacterium]
MTRYFPVALLLAAAVVVSTTGFQCGSAETTSAKLYMQQKQWQKAEESLLKQVAKNDKDEEAWYLLGQTRLELKNYKGMNEAYTHALAVSDAHKADIGRNRLAVWAMLYNEGVNYYNRGRDSASYYDRALENFTTATLLVPDSAGTYYVTALAQYAKKDNATAIRSLESALGRKPDFADAARLLGQLHYAVAAERSAAKDSVGARAEYGKAAAAFESAYAAQPDNPDNITNLIDAYERTDQLEKAEGLTRDAMLKDPGNKLYRYAYGVFLLKKEKYAEAIEQFTKALEIDPGYADAKYNLGVAYLNWGVSMKAAIDKASESTRKGTKPQKEDLSYREKFKLSLPYLEESAGLRPDDAALWTQLGKLYAILNMSEKSKAAFERSDKLAKDR